MLTRFIGFIPKHKKSTRICSVFQPGQRIATILARHRSDSARSDNNLNYMNKNCRASKVLKPLPAPIIIIGMHRSGTTMLARQLEALSVFMGKKKEANHESTFFLNVNRWLMAQSGGSWDNPQAIHYLLENREARRRVVDYIERYLLRTPRVISYLGWGI